MLKLLTDVRPGNPTIGLRWCIDKEDKAALKGTEMANLFVLIVVLYADRAGEDRQFVPLSQLMTYVGFRYPGTHKVFARLVCASEKQLLEVKKHFLERSNRRHYNYDVVTYEQDEILTGGYGVVDVSGDEFEIEMPKEYFAKEPAPWLKRWANMWYRFPPVDQCEFRRRVMLAFSLKWAAVLFFLLCWALFGLLWSITAVFFGARRISIKTLFHPWKSNLYDGIWPEYTNDQGKHGRHSWIVSDKEGNTRLWTILVSPPLYVSLGLILLYIHWRFGLGYREMLSLAIEKLRLALIWVMQTGPTMLAILATVFVCFLLGKWAIDKSIQIEHDPKRQARKKVAQETHEQELLRLLSCTKEIASPDAVSLKGVPRKRRSLKLIYLSTKRDLCKQYAG